MVVKRKLCILILVLFSVSTLLWGCSGSTSSNGQEKPVDKKKVVKIGISQIVEHPALDAARKGFIQALESKGFKDGDNIQIDYQNAQGDIPTAGTIAQNFVSQKKDLILAIATPSAQAAYNATKDIPILITAVTDPVKSGLAKSMDKPETNVSGTSDMITIDKQFNLIKKFVPNAKRIGVLYNTSETNSEIQVQDAKNAAPKFGFEITVSGVTTTNDIPQALDALLKNIDVLYVPTDNLIVSSAPVVISKCTERKIPIISAERSVVDSGALATEGIDYTKLGFQTGLMAAEIINGKSIKDMSISVQEDTKLVINETTAQKLGITIPEDLKSKAELVK